VIISSSKLSLSFEGEHQSNQEVSVIEIKQIEVVVKDIYQGKDNHWINDFANDYKVTTKEDVVINRLPFQAGDKVSLDELKEAERILRNLAYLRDAIITLPAWQA
jgi:outer membrane protein assembly factor BamA